MSDRREKIRRMEGIQGTERARENDWKDGRKEAGSERNG